MAFELPTKSDPFPDLSFDDLLAKLSPEELEKLTEELVDPDVSSNVFGRSLLSSLIVACSN